MNWLTQTVNGYLLGEESVLSVGVGLGTVDDGLRCKNYVGFDVYRPYLRKAKDSLPAVFEHDARDMTPFLTDSFDVVLLLDIVEHLEQKEAERLILQAERIARRLTIMYTPSGFVEQKLNADGKDSWGYANPAQEHKCGFTIEWLEEHGWDAKVILPDSNIIATKVVKK